MMIAQYIMIGKQDGLFVSCVASCLNRWAIVMDSGTGFTAQVYELSEQFLPDDWINEQWEEKYYISALAGADNGCSLVVMSKGMQYYFFPFRWIKKKWSEGSYVTSIVIAGNRWAVVMSRNAGFSDQVIFFYVSYLEEKKEPSSEIGEMVNVQQQLPQHLTKLLLYFVYLVGNQTTKHKRYSEHLLFHFWISRRSRQKIFVASLCYGRTVS
ncbi:unnamed protein product [Musa hybrid cultivar]